MKTEANPYPAAALNADYGHVLQDPSHFNIDHFTQQGGGANVNGGGGSSSSTAGGPDRRPRGRQGAAKRTGACARCRRLKVRTCLGGTLIPRTYVTRTRPLNTNI